ncbi:MAG TPA: DedA family protein [Proteobacteria bacterium]|nr:SNARE associated Golgi protein [bacterium BMS3Abin14]HDL54250.1 DedA family protein [Pseudomonadota bacterium]
MSGLVQWVIAWSHNPSSVIALFGLAFAESSFFPIPPDVLLIAMALIRPREAFVFALVCSAGSLIGGMFGYFLGWVGGRPLLHRFFSEAKINMVKDAYEKYEVWAIGIAGFTPIPYKVFTLSAGTFAIPFIPFAAVSAISRSARFFLVAGSIFLWGEEMKVLIERYFNWFTLVFVALLLGGFLILKPLVKRNSSQTDN